MYTLSLLFFSVTVLLGYNFAEFSFVSLVKGLIGSEFLSHKPFPYLTMVDCFFLLNINSRNNKMKSVMDFPYYFILL